MTADIESPLPDRFANRVPVVDVIIPVYGGLNETRRCLDSMLAFPQQAGHAIAVVLHPT
jgi:hypothetical protein